VNHLLGELLVACTEPGLPAGEAGRIRAVLAEGATVTETAHACGWATASAFVDTFARTMGQTPGAYRSGSAGRAPAEGGA
jgi:methylphosphotriester-DNA--protein-cysteine methyltransferase